MRLIDDLVVLAILFVILLSYSLLWEAAIEKTADYINKIAERRKGMAHVIKIVCYTNGKSSPYDGQYLKSYDANFVLPNGAYDGGKLETTPNIEEAQKFLSAKEVFTKWKETAPRPWNIRLYDGQPNRPLTAFTIEVIQHPRE